MVDQNKILYSMSVISWFKESNRYIHILGCFTLSAVFGWQAGVGASFTTEAKDVQASKSIKSWDWLDFTCNLIGTALGGIVHFFIVKLLF